jgi:heme/copper-type cytochrome/quinol oxidase subunit 2
MPSNFSFGFQSSVTPIMEGIVDLHNHIFFFLVLVFVFVFWIFGNVLYHFWWRIAHPRNLSDLLDRSALVSFRHLSHSTFLEVVLTIIPSFILVAIAIPSFALLYAMDEIMEPTLTLKVIGHQWYWSYEYSNCISHLTIDPVEHPELVPQSFWEHLISSASAAHEEFLAYVSKPRGFSSMMDFYEHANDSQYVDRFMEIHNAVSPDIIKGVYEIRPEDVPLPEDIAQAFGKIIDVPIPGFSFKQYEDMNSYIESCRDIDLRAIDEEFVSHINQAFDLPAGDPIIRNMKPLLLNSEAILLELKIRSALGQPISFVGKADNIPAVHFDSYMLNEDELLKRGDYRLLEVDEPVVLPVNTHIRLLITADDVIHSFAVPQLGIKVDAVPGRLNQQGIFIKRSGVFYGQCSELCGVNHGFMPIVIKGVSMKDFVYWYLNKFNSLYPEYGYALANVDEITGFLNRTKFPEFFESLEESLPSSESSVEALISDFSSVSSVLNKNNVPTLFNDWRATFESKK